MFVSVPASLGDFGRNVSSVAVAESVDLFPTLAELAGIESKVTQELAGESLVPLLRTTPGSLNKTFALSQWPRRPSCVDHHGCEDGHGDPSAMQPDAAVMGYTYRTAEWRYGAWFPYDWAATAPDFSKILARELYSHNGDTGSAADAELYENVNLASDPSHAATVGSLHALLVTAVTANLRQPIPSTQ